MQYKVCSFNLNDFGFGKRINNGDDAGKKNFDKIADIINQEKLDIVACQEILDAKAVDWLTINANKKAFNGVHWSSVYILTKNINEKKQEGFAFIWNDRRLSLVKEDDEENPKIIMNYKIRGIPGQKDLARYPAFVRFVPHRGNFEIRLLNVHIRSSKGKSDAYVDSDLSDSAVEKLLRQNEFELLISQILPMCTTKRDGNNRKYYTFMLGDYNIPLNFLTGGNTEYIRAQVFERKAYKDVIDRNKKRHQMVSVQEELTSLKRGPRDGTEIVGNKYKNNFDHFSYDNDIVGDVVDWSNRPCRIEALGKYYEDDLNAYRSEVSDHVPIVLTIEI